MRRNKWIRKYAGALLLACVSIFAVNEGRAQQAQRTASRNVASSSKTPRKPGPPTIPKVLLTKQEQALCRVNVGDQMPAIALPQLGGTREARLSDLLGKKATVVIFWKTDRRMTQQQLADMRRDVVDPFGSRGVAVVGVAVKENEADSQATLTRLQVTWPNLLDEKGEAFAQVGSEKLPRTYLLDSQGKILWFDLEYSMGTRRDLMQALRALAVEPAAAKGK